MVLDWVNCYRITSSSSRTSVECEQSFARRHTAIDSRNKHTPHLQSSAVSIHTNGLSLNTLANQTLRTTQSSMTLTPGSGA